MDGRTWRETASTRWRGDERTSDERRVKSRRRLLGGIGAAGAALLAGCSGLLPGDDSIHVTASDAGDRERASPTPPEEVNVVGLGYDSDGTSYEFHVTLHAPVAGGADWWQVETLGGDRLARHGFHEPVTGSKVTTSSTVTIEGADAVVVRAHGAGSGYGGQVMLADLTEGFITLEKQGDEPESFADYTF